MSPVQTVKDVPRKDQDQMAERTGLEPATTGVTGQYSNQLNYRSEMIDLDLNRGVPTWWVLQGSNLRPVACKATALPAELNTHLIAARNFTNTRIMPTSSNAITGQ